MSDSLRDRIAGLQRFHIPVDYAGYIECSCGVECKPDHGGIDVAEQIWGEHVADAVIAELGIRQEWTWSWQSSSTGANDYGLICATREEAATEGPNPVCRYVTDWTPG